MRRLSMMLAAVVMVLTPLAYTAMARTKRWVEQNFFLRARPLIAACEAKYFPGGGTVVREWYVMEEEKNVVVFLEGRRSEYGDPGVVVAIVPLDVMERGDPDEMMKYVEEHVSYVMTD